MTVSVLNPADPPVVTAYHLVCLLACSDCALNRHIAQGLVPRPDARVTGNGKVWKLSTLRAWRPDIGIRSELLNNVL
jgi:hypothetical protein